MNEFNLNKKYNWELAHEPIVKTYKAILSQIGTSAPVPTVLVNTLGENITINWTRTGTGDYVGTLSAGEFDPAKTYIQIEAGYYSQTYFIFAGVNPSVTSTIVVQSEDAAAANIDLGLLTAGTAFIEVNLY
jgi:hypothetical protein